MWLTPKVTRLLVKAFPELEGLLDNQGSWIVIMLKALYGLVQLAAL